MEINTLGYYLIGSGITFAVLPLFKFLEGKGNEISPRVVFNFFILALVWPITVCLSLFFYYLTWSNNRGNS